MSNESRLTYLRLLSALPTANAIIAGDGVIIHANASMRDLFGVNVEGEHLSFILRAPSVIEAFERTRREGVSTSARNEARSATSRTIDVSFSPLAKHEDGRDMLLATCSDVTREQLVERMRSDFVANASHELRTPLTTLSGFIDTMQGAAKNDEKARGEFLKVMKAQADRMSSLIDDLLSLSRIELDEHLPPNAEVNLTSVVKQAQDLLQSLVQDNQTTLTVDMPDQLTVKGDANQLTQVLHNLIENAVKYSGIGKQVKVSGRIEGSLAIVCVQDNGRGIAAHHVPRLTERFYRVNVQDSRNRGGTGLGLAICKHIVNRHRGRLLIESEPGAGSSFTIQLPKSF